MRLQAQHGDFHRAYATPHLAVWHYASADHTLDDMANAKYFRTMIGQLQPRDRIEVIDKNERYAVVVIQYVDEELSEVGIASLDTLSATPMGCEETGGFQIRFAGGKGRGSRYQIVDGSGEILMDNIAGKRTAERELEELTREAA